VPVKTTPAMVRVPRGRRRAGPAATKLASRWRQWASTLRLDQRFALAGSVVSFFGMLIIGAWVSSEIEEGVTRNSAISTAVYMESFIAPFSQELAGSDTLSAETRSRLREILHDPAVAERIVSAKIWKKGGLVAFSTDPALTGKRFEPSENLSKAWEGHLMASFDEIGDEEAAGERETGIPLLEVYNPIHSIVTGEVIAVAEIYQNAMELEEDLLEARLTSWVVVAGVTLMTFALLFGIVRNGSNVIARQHRELESRLGEISRVSDQNAALRHRIQAAALRAGTLNERYLRRIGAELHDGPAQALALASLRLDSLARSAGRDGEEEEVAVIRRSLEEAMHDIRLICRGLTLPELEGRTLDEVVALAVSAHERRTGTSVALDGAAPAAPDRPIDHSTLICTYRFVQEGLMNAYRHAGGRGQRVASRFDGSSIEITVQDEGPGFNPHLIDQEMSGLGLNGLRERIDSTGGEFRIDSAPGRGTRLIMRLPLGE